MVSDLAVLPVLGVALWSWQMDLSPVSPFEASSIWNEGVMSSGVLRRWLVGDLGLGLYVFYLFPRVFLIWFVLCSQV
jgi:hypothetical protein